MVRNGGIEMTFANGSIYKCRNCNEISINVKYEKLTSPDNVYSIELITRKCRRCNFIEVLTKKEIKEINEFV